MFARSNLLLCEEIKEKAVEPIYASLGLLLGIIAGFVVRHFIG